MDSTSLQIFLFQLRREFIFQLDGRRLHPRGVYPGVSWFLSVCILAIGWEFNSSRSAPHMSQTAFGNFGTLFFCLSTLICVRATVYTALSYARDLQNHSATVVRCSPLSPSSVLLAKTIACLTPLWIELALFFPVALIFYSVYLPVNPAVVITAFPILFFLSLAFAAIGLAVGSMTDQPVHAVRNAKLLVYFLLFIGPVLGGFTGGGFVPVLVLAVWLSTYSRRAPHRQVVLGTAWGGLILSAIASKLGILSTETYRFTPLNLFDSELVARYHESSESLVQNVPFWWNEPSSSLAPIFLYAATTAIMVFLARIRYRYAR